MRRVSSSEARARFARLLDAVAQGETVVLTRHGRPIARILPEPGPYRARVARAIANIEAMRERNGG